MVPVPPRRHVKVGELVWSSSPHVWPRWDGFLLVLLRGGFGLGRPAAAFDLSLRWRHRSSASSSWCTRWRNFAGRSAWKSLDQGWTAGLRPVSWTALSASLTQANSSWIDWNRRRNPSQSSQKAFLTDLSITSLEKKGSSRNEEQLMGWLKKAVGELAPTSVTLGTSCPLRMDKDQYLVWAGIWGLEVFGVVFF